MSRQEIFYCHTSTTSFNTKSQRLNTHTHTSDIVDQYSMHFFRISYTNSCAWENVNSNNENMCKYEGNGKKKRDGRKDETFNKPRRKKSDALYIHVHCYSHIEIPSHYCLLSAFLFCSSLHFSLVHRERKRIWISHNCCFLSYFILFFIFIVSKYTQNFPN